MLELKNMGKISAEELDVYEHFDYLYKLSKNNKKTNFPFELIYSKTLDYKIQLATQSLVSYVFDLNGTQRYNPLDFKTSIISRYFYIDIFPYQNKTYIFFFIEKSNKPFVKDIIEQFNKLSDSDKLQFLFISLIIHSEYLFINPSFKELLLKDKKLKGLYSSTDNSKNFDAFREIKNFKNYTNYFSNKNIQ